ncbi:MAG: DUF2891 domain-containing protein [Betaproteobacteria bacterium]|nr:MAG: DUF2891 domain-containing protein [Betaproteobacteria bacterium]
MVEISPSLPIHAVFARTALENVRREYPNFMMHFVHSDAECANLTPSSLHPIFFGSYDWHSCVHMHWSMARLLALDLHSDHGKAIASWFDRQFDESRAKIEAAYFDRDGAAHWQRPYGWSWLLKLYSELAVSPHPHAARWCAGLRPLADRLSDALFHHLQTAPTPVRHGVHSNTSFAMIHALRFANTVGDHAFMDLIAAKARQWFGNDVDYRMAYDFSGEDFLSPALTESLLMSVVLPLIEFRHWFDDFLPDLKTGHFAELEPAKVTDETDAKQVHNHGLNLSRAWCMRGLMQVIDPSDLRWKKFGVLAGEHTRAAEAAITSGEYVSTHWLISFALLAETEWHG